MGAGKDRAGGVWHIDTEMRVGIVGCGTMGKVYYQCFSRIPGCCVTAVVSGSVSPETAKRQGFRVFRTLEELLRSQDLDVICICTPTDLHALQVSQVLRRGGIHVICEKPLCLHAQQAQALYQLAQMQGVTLFAAHVMRFSETGEWLREAVQSNRFGPVREAFFSRLSERPHWCAENWAYDPARSGLVPFDLHIHDLDLIVSLFGPPISADCRGSGSRSVPYDEHLFFTYEYPAFRVTAEAAWYVGSVPFSATFRVCFERAVVFQKGNQITVYEHNKPPYAALQSDETAYPTGFSVPATDMYDRELQYFVQCIRDARKQVIPEPEQVVSVLAILEQLEKKIRPQID